MGTIREVDDFPVREMRDSPYRAIAKKANSLHSTNLPPANSPDTSSTYLPKTLVDSGTAGGSTIVAAPHETKPVINHNPTYGTTGTDSANHGYSLFGSYDLLGDQLVDLPGFGIFPHNGDTAATKSGANADASTPPVAPADKAPAFDDPLGGQIANLPGYPPDPSANSEIPLGTTAPATTSPAETTTPSDMAPSIDDTSVQEWLDYEYAVPGRSLFDTDLAATGAVGGGFDMSAFINDGLT